MIESLLSVPVVTLAERIAEATFFPLEFGRTIQILTWWVSIAFVMTGGYLIFLSERKLPILGFSLGVFGICVYFLVQFPEDMPLGITLSWLLSIALVVLSVIGGYTTLILWLYYELDPPWVRIPELLSEKFS